MDVVFAPDWSEGVPYQRLLAQALGKQDVHVRFLYGYKRFLPLSRAMRARPADILHLHWPEAYYPPRNDGFDWFRRARFQFDLRLALRHCRLATTGHNLAPHNRAHERFAIANIRNAFRSSDVIFAHSNIAKQRMAESFGLRSDRISVIPHGDLSVTLGPPVPHAEARATLSLPADGKIALIFGMVEPYKGQEEIIEWWRTAATDTTLAIVGKPMNTAYRDHLLNRIGDAKNIIARFEWLPDAMLRDWLCASDCVLFNYRRIFTSGAANLARSWGLPIVLPARLDTVVLDEPCAFVHRFTSVDTDFRQQLDHAMSVRPDFSAAAQWRRETSWDHVASLTLAGYRMALGMPHEPTQPVIPSCAELPES